NVLSRNALAGSRPHIGHIEIGVAVIIVIETADPHARACIFNSCMGGNIVKGSVALIAVKVLAAKVVHHVKVGPAVAVEIGPATAKTVAGVIAVQAGLGCNVMKRAVACIAHQEIRRPVFRVVVGTGIAVLAGTLVIDVETEVDVEPAIAIVIGDGGAGEGALRRGCELKRIRPLAELAASQVGKKERTVGPRHDQILTAVIIEVGENGAGGIFQHTYPGRLGDVPKGTVAAIVKQAIRKTGRLADVNVVKTVVVNVAHGNPVVSVDINTASAVENGAPVIGPARQLRGVARISTQGLGRDIGENGSLRAAAALFPRPPVAQLESGTRHRFPLQVPMADTLLTMKIVARAHHFVAHTSLQSSGRVGCGEGRRAADAGY